MSVWRNGIKYIYMFLFPLKNVACKGLRVSTELCMCPCCSARPQVRWMQDKHHLCLTVEVVNTRGQEPFTISEDRIAFRYYNILFLTFELIGAWEMRLKSWIHFQIDIKGISSAFLWNCPQVNAMRLHRWLFNIGSGNEWLCAARQEAITWANVDQVLWYHMLLVGHNEIIH